MAKHPKETKTNAMRILDQAHVPYQTKTYEADGTQTGLEIAQLLNMDPENLFKTLVTQGKSKTYHVFMVPVASSLDLKKAAAAAGEKSIEMIPQKDLLPLTGYIHGGCSPLGMKKQFSTIIDETAQLFDIISFSGGKIGCQIQMNPEELAHLIDATFEDITT